jgi:hypothetical protein
VSSRSLDLGPAPVAQAVVQAAEHTLLDQRQQPGQMLLEQPASWCGSAPMATGVPLCLINGGIRDVQEEDSGAPALPDAAANVREHGHDERIARGERPGHPAVPVQDRGMAPAQRVADVGGWETGIFPQ